MEKSLGAMACHFHSLALHEGDVAEFSSHGLQRDSRGCQHRVPCPECRADEPPLDFPSSPMKIFCKYSSLNIFAEQQQDNVPDRGRFRFLFIGVMGFVLLVASGKPNVSGAASFRGRR